VDCRAIGGAKTSRGIEGQRARGGGVIVRGIGGARS
jgi:hypothetical protein